MVVNIFLQSGRMPDRRCPMLTYRRVGGLLLLIIQDRVSPIAYLILFSIQHPASSIEHPLRKKTNVLGIGKVSSLTRD